MKMFVTGGAGFIGSHLVDRLLTDGHSVTVFDDLSSGRLEFIKHNLERDDFSFVEADLVDRQRLRKEISGHDVVFHIAANPDVRAGPDHPEIAEKDMLITYGLLDEMRRADISKIVFSSSSVIYGEMDPHPISEDEGPLLPISVYGAAKLASEGLISSFAHTFDMQAWMYRFANVVGSRGTHGVIVDFVNKLRKNPSVLEILGDGRQKKPYLYVSECVDGIVFGFENAAEQLNYFNLGTDGVTSVTRIAQLVVDEMGLSDVSFEYTGGRRGWKGDVPQFQFDIGKMKRLGWQPKFSSDEAVRMAIQDVLSM